MREFVRSCPVSVKNTTRFTHICICSISKLLLIHCDKSTICKCDKYDLWHSAPPSVKYALHVCMIDWQVNVCSQFYEPKSVCQVYPQHNTDQYFHCNFPRLCRSMSVQYVSGSLTFFPSKIAFTTVSVVPAHLCCPVNWEIAGVGGG